MIPRCLFSVRLCSEINGSADVVALLTRASMEVIVSKFIPVLKRATGVGLAMSLKRQEERLRRPRSARLDTRELDHLAPLLGFFFDELAEVGRGTREGRAAQVVEPRLHPRIGESDVDLSV